MASKYVTRRSFLAGCAVGSAAAACAPWSVVRGAGVDPKAQTAQWLAMREDPVRKMFPGEPDLDKILTLFPRTTGYAAYDPRQIAENIKKLQPTPAIDTGHPFVDLSVKTGLAMIDATFQGDRPKYGVKFYGEARHDSFVPTVIAAVDALSLWGMNRRAKQLLRYWLATFVRDDGTIRYEHVKGHDATSIAEYGQLLHIAAVLEARGGAADWWAEGFRVLDRIAELLLRLHAAAVKGDGLIPGVPEADKWDTPGRFFHNNAWAAKGIGQWADLCERQKAHPATATATMRKVCSKLAQDTLRAIERTWPADPDDWWLSPQVEGVPKPAKLTQGWELGSYTNYRYWPELLSSGLLPPPMANRVVNARLTGGGQFCGMSRFGNFLDDWPMFDYLDGLWALGRKNDFLLSLYGHIAYHQAEGHLTAYESVTFPPGKVNSDYCLPSQLIAARAARRLVK